jgi:Tfp pilus assembly protein PilO
MSKNSNKVAPLVPPAPWTDRIKPKSVLIALAVLAVFDLAFYIFAVFPLANREADQRVLLAALEQQVESRRENLTSTEEVADRLDQADEQGLQLVDQITLERRTAFSELLSELGSAAGESGVDVRETAYEVESVDGSDNYGILSINANFRGRYENLVKLLNVLDRSDLFFIIHSLGASPRADSDSNELQINMRVDTFVRNL